MDYQQAGVNIDAGNEAVKRIKPLIKQTHSSQVLGHLGLFAGCYELPAGYRQPVLVSCTDGVGTKLKIAIDTGVLGGLGIDLVAMCVNDLICCGADPLFFLDYIACHQLIPSQIESIVEGMVKGCQQSGCSIVGGEMAEMNDLYKVGDFDLAGFSVGIVEKADIIDGQSIRPGDFIYGFASSGIHSNGYSLVRKVLTSKVCEDHNISSHMLLEPTRIYVKDIKSLRNQSTLKGIAHITGGGLHENIERILPSGLSIHIDRSALPVPEIFNLIQSVGNVSDLEMSRVFNMGIGMIVISSDHLPEQDDFKRIGTVKSL